MIQVIVNLFNLLAISSKLEYYATMVVYLMNLLANEQIGC